MEQKGKGYKVVRTIEAFEHTKMQEVTSYVAITEKNEKLCPEIQVAFEHKVAPDIDGFTDEPVVKCGSSSLSCRKYFSI